MSSLSAVFGVSMKVMQNQFMDCVDILIRSGNGGDGIVAWRREKFVAFGGPAGGDGGKGGDVWLEATTRMNTLIEYQNKRQFQGEDGANGGNKNQFGKSGNDITLYVPCGTVVKDKSSGRVIADLTQDGERVLLASGGRGGRGNNKFSSSKRQAPQFAEPGEPGIERKLIFELKLLADVGLVGLPNAGKSTLLSVLSQARPKIADYPFTTLTPNLGVVKIDAHQNSFVLADIPGLIEGASQGQGLGHDFLRHIQRTRVLWHLLDMSELTQVPPVEAYEMIQAELKAFDPNLVTKPTFVVLTKADTVTDTEWLEQLKADLSKKTGLPVFVISSVAQQGLNDLLQVTWHKLLETPRVEKTEEVLPDPEATNHDDSPFRIETLEPGLVRVSGGRVERLARVTDITNQTALQRLMNIYRSMGVLEALKSAEVKPGITVIVGEHEFEYVPE